MSRPRKSPKDRKPATKARRPAPSPVKRSRRSPKRFFKLEKAGWSQVPSNAKTILSLEKVLESVAVSAASAQNSHRANVLEDARNLTLGARNRSYGDPLENFTVTTDLKRIFWGAVARSNVLKNKHESTAGSNDPQNATGNDPRTSAVYSQNTPFGHAIDMILTNLGRIATTPSAEVQYDRYVDTAAYSAIAYEVGVQLAVAATAVKQAESRGE